ncbi:MAG TPA: FkbM family methyltransferase [Fimbriiglobus sp.]|nr:FkbM family methyltransferase [Fimbriiglobus sp.]
MRLRNIASDFQVLRDTVFDNEYRLASLDARCAVVDVGAHVGCFALLAWAAGARRIVCVEPDPDNFRLLEENLAELRAAGVDATAIQAAVWAAEQGPARFRAGDQSTVGRVGDDGDEVDAVTLGYLLGVAGRDKTPVGLVKIDIEGGEFGLLRHTPPEVLARAGAYAVEVHPDAGNPGEIADRLRRAGFDEQVWHAGSGRTGTLQLHASRADA